ncbi:oxysterol binding protein (Osh5), putative [Cordyceps militaris CM01]|uniref:Oxysterol binding protein (Osh5), putative n=2 Tax=Cordyceps militaris TaxID=73501 RepID=G3J5T0_CORMM|nr:oxysterol binding protein (Osh5), putative [Cordyceps militaris CM01]ATY65804.1 oxysterol binding (Osh5) [Cordyceps militaris]EGX96087.1 oxysterol binding protein (Osh5), putative [Cordyceps militaris CM01]
MSSATAQAQAASGSWSAFLKSIASFNGDLSSLTAPPFILSSQSLTEFSAYWSTHPNLLVAAASEIDPAKRSMLVLKWFLSTLKHQYASRSEQFGNEKKPLNPFLGELFLGSWNDTAGKTTLVSEQVSHHPPTTAYCVRNEKTGIQLEGYNAQKATFHSTIIVKQIGHAVLTIPIGDKKEPEHYLITLPSLHIEGLIFGAPFVELDGTSFITSSTGFRTKIDYSGKGWLSGKKNTVIATITPTSKEKDVLYNSIGQWTEKLEFYSGPAKKNSKSTLVDEYDAAKAAQTELQISPVDKQHPLESRRAWAKVATGIQSGDMDLVSAEKGKIENAQRALRHKETVEERAWERRYFTAVAVGTTDPVLEQLGAAGGVALDGERDKTGGLWRFDAKKAEAADAEKLAEEQIATLEREVLGQ